MAGRDEESKLRVPRGFGRPWLRSERPVAQQVVQPLESFLRTELGSGSLLLGAAVLALVWINVAEGSYSDFWTTTIKVELGSLSLEEDLRHLVNDLLMAIFFFVVALEVKREYLFGALREGGSAGVPVVAAFGTMVGAALAYIAINLDGGNLNGWAVPIATDIAFVLAVLGIAGDRVPSELRAFMLTLAVVDDLAAIVVIAVFFTADFSVAWLGGAAAAAVALVVLRRLHVRALPAYVVLAGLLWLAIFESGIHGTIAGVIVGFLTPAKPFYPREQTAEVIGSQLKEMTRLEQEVGEATMRETSRLAVEAVSPLARMETVFHPYSAYIILPLFALANAGVVVSLDTLEDALTSQVGLGIIIGLVVGKPIGGVLGALAIVRFSRVSIPRGLDWSAITAAAPLKGVGFTVAIFIAVLAFDDPVRVEQAKLAILIASVLAGLVGFAALVIRNRLRAR